LIPVAAVAICRRIDQAFLLEQRLQRLDPQRGAHPGQVPTPSAKAAQIP